MDDSISKSLSKLRLSSKRLNKLTDQANQTVKEVEKFLEDCSLGVYATVPIKSWEVGCGEEFFTCLEYCRVGSRYRIAITSGLDNSDPSEHHVKPWSDASRDEKLESIKKLPDLIAEIGKLVDEKIVSAEIGLGEVSEALNELSGREG